MDNNFAPTYEYLFGEHYLLWYRTSNSYSIVDTNYKLLLQRYLDSDSLEAFYNAIDFSKVEISKNDLTKSIKDYLNSCNIPYIGDEENKVEFDNSNRKISKIYNFKNKVFRIFYDSSQVQNYIHPSLSYCETENKKSIDFTFDVYLKNEKLCLFKNEVFVNSYPKRDYHKLQGKFIIHLLSFLHDKDEEDWIGTFHGSTITNEKSSILFIGDSGKGKSTLCAILAANGYKMIADDVSPLLSETLHIFNNPSAISIKKGAFEVLKAMIPDFNSFETITLNKTKGEIKYIPNAAPKQNHYPCENIILVNYIKGVKIKLEETTVVKILETLIPESWLSPNPKHAKQFLDWLKNVKFYELTYSDTKSVIDIIDDLFKKDSSNNSIS